VRVTYDPEVDAVYIRFGEEASEVTTHRLTEEAAVNYAPDGHVVGIEILDASTHMFQQGAERTVTLENLIPVTVS